MKHNVQYPLRADDYNISTISKWRSITVHNMSNALACRCLFVVLAQCRSTQVQSMRVFASASPLSSLDCTRRAYALLGPDGPWAQPSQPALSFIHSFIPSHLLLNRQTTLLPLFCPPHYYYSPRPPSPLPTMYVLPATAELALKTAEHQTPRNTPHASLHCCTSTRSTRILSSRCRS